MRIIASKWFAAIAVAGAALAGSAGAEEKWQPFNPFAEVEKRKAAKRESAAEKVPPAEARPYLRPMTSPEGQPGPVPGERAPATAKPPGLEAGQPQPAGAAQQSVMRDAIPPSVEKGDLAPVMAGDGSGLPFELWQGLDAAAIEGLMKDLEIPPRSPALHNLWKRLITSDVTPPAGAQSNTQFAALRLEALYRSGLAKDAAAELAKQPAASDPLFATLAARNELASGNAEKACEIARQSATMKGSVPPLLKGQAILLSGYCAVLANDAAAAGLTAELAREAGVEASAGLEALDAFSIGAKPAASQAKRMSLLDFKIVERAGGAPIKDLPGKSEPALLVALGSDSAATPDTQLQAAEAAARLNALAPDGLAATYQSLAGGEAADALLTGDHQQTALRRAALFKAAIAEQTPMKKTRLMRALVDDAKRQGLLFQTLQMLAPVTATINPQPEVIWFAETATEIGIASGQLDLARRWIALAGGPGGAPAANLGHWLALADIADPALENRGASLSALESLAVTGKFTPESLHRLATVLDALAYQVPIPLWDAASRTPQPNTGYLPPTGVLSELQDAAKKKEFGRTVLLVMKALGPAGAEGAHMIALGDSIRALKRAGLEADARRLGVEALLASWPHTAVN